MAAFDLDSYLANRIGTGNKDKIEELAAASASKVAALSRMTQAIDQRRKQNASSWVSQADLDPNGAVGGALNVFASYTSGASRVLGQLASLPANVGSIADLSGMNEGDFQARDRFVKGVATKEDMMFLNSYVSDDGMTINQLFERADNQKQLGRDITTGFDKSSIVHQDKRQAFNAALAENFQGNWDKVTSGWDQANKGKVVDGAVAITTGLAKLLYNAGDAAINNKQAASEYIVENIPQLIAGAGGRTGLLTASNVGYATDKYQQGIENYQKTHQGAYPPEAERQKMAMLSAWLALAEQVGELGQLKAMLPVKQAGKDTARAGFLASLRNTGVATVEGAASEAPTEGFQTWAEGQITGKPATPLEIYQGAVIGAVSGGGLSGTGHGVAEMTGNTEEKIARRNKLLEESASFADAVKANDPSVFLDPQSRNFDPSKAVGVLHKNSQLKETTPEAKQENLTKARDIVTNFGDTLNEAQMALSFMQKTPEQKQSRIAALIAERDASDQTDTIMLEIRNQEIAKMEALLPEASKKDVKVKQAEINEMSRQFARAKELSEGLFNEVGVTAPKEEIVATVEQANKAVDLQDPVAVTEAQKHVNKVISLSMANVNHLSAEEATQLADNKSNALTEPQRTYLREFSAARIAENQLESVDSVHKTILYGDGKGNRGIKDYRKTIGQALALGDQKTADREMNLLRNFVKGQTEKATAITAALAQAKKLKGLDGVTVVKPLVSAWEIATREYKPKELEANGSLFIHKASTKLVNTVQQEAAAVNQSLKEHETAYGIAFPTTVAPSTASAPLATASPTPGATAVSAAPNVPLKELATLVPGEQVTLYRGESAANDKNGQWWTTDKAYAEQYGAVTEVTLPSEIVGQYAAQGHDAKTTFVFGSKKPTELRAELDSKPADTTNAASEGAAVAPAAAVGEAVQTEVVQSAAIPPENNISVEKNAEVEPRPKKNKGGSRLRSAAYDKNPLMTFLAKHGLYHVKGDSKSQKTEFSPDKPILISGYGPIFKRTGLKPDALVQLAIEDGYLPKDGTEDQLRGLIQQAISGKKISPLYAEGVAEQLGELRYEDHLAQQQEAAQDEQYQPNVVPEELGLTNEDLEVSGYNEADAALQLEVNSLLLQAQELGLFEEIQQIYDDAFNSETKHDQLTRQKAGLINAIASRSRGTGGETAGRTDRNPDAQEAVSQSNEDRSQVAETSSSEKAEAVTKPEVTYESGKLDALKTPSEEGTPYKKRNLLADFFQQKEGNPSDASVRPLVAIKNFMSMVAQNPELLASFLKESYEDSVLSDKQKELFALFQKANTQWSVLLQKDLIKGYWNKEKQIIKEADDFRFKDLMQFLLEEGINTEGKPILELAENVKTALVFAGFSWIAENGGKSRYNTPDEINAILLRDDDETPSGLEWKLLGDVGIRENVIRNSLGQKALSALGFSVKANAPKDLMPKLESAMGAYIEKVLMEEKILKRVTLSGEEMASVLPTAEIKAKYHFLRLARNEDGKLRAKAQAIFDANKGTESILNKIFSVESGLKAPSLKPIPVKQKTTKNTEQGIPAILQKYLKKENAEGNFIRQDMWNLMQQLPASVVHSIIGVKAVSDETTQLMNRASIGAKNDGLVREYEQYMDYVAWMEAEGLLDSPIFLDHSAWKQQRVGIATNVLNPQTSKFHRFMMYRGAWETKVDPDNDADMNNFRLRVLESFGVKTDKESNATSLAGYDKKINDPVIQDAVAVLVKTLEGGTLTAEEAQLVANAVEAGGSNTHSLDGLMGLAQQAFAKGEPFTVHMMGEIDGVTNGPMLTHLLMGAASSVTELLAMLNRGGFFEKGNPFTQYNVWREQKTNRDLYENTTFNMMGVLDSMGLNPDTLKALNYFTGNLTEVDATGFTKVLKAGRNIIKTPLTAMVFGSSLDTSVGNMANEFIGSIYDTIEKLNKEQKDPTEFIQKLNHLLGSKNEINPKSDLKMLMETEFTKQQVKALQNVFTNTLGEAVKTTIERDFKTFIEYRKVFNRSAKLAFDLYNAVYTGVRESFINELMDSKEIDFSWNKKKTIRTPNQALSKEQEKMLDSRLKDIQPLLHTAMSKEGGDLNAGLFIAKTRKRLSEEDTHKGAVHFRTGFVDNDAFVANTTGYETVKTDPGVAMLPMSTHSLDSYISHMAAFLGEVLNVHDAHGSGLKDFTQTGKNLNSATWDVVMGYSPMEEMQNAVSRVVLGVETLLKSRNVPADVFANVAEVVGNIRQPKGTENLLLGALNELSYTRYMADGTKLKVGSLLASVDQYALEGGNHLVTDEQRAEAATRLTQHIKQGSQLDPKLEAAVLSITTMLKNPPKAATKTTDFLLSEQQDLDQLPTSSPFGELGTPIVESNAKLEALLAATPVMSAKTLVQELQKLLGGKNKTNMFRLEIMNKIESLLPADLMVHYVTPNTDANTVLPNQDSLNARGWYSATLDKQGIFVLSSDFKYSGITTELLVHELLHGVLAQVIEANPDHPQVKELQGLLEAAKALVKDQQLTQFAEATKNIHELVSWGMSNTEFQQQVLMNISAFGPKTGKQVIANGMKRFVNAITGLLFGKEFVKEGTQNAMSQLLGTVGNLFALAKAQKHPNMAPMSQSQVGTGAATNTYSTQDIYTALDTGAISASFDGHLREILGSIVEKMQGPFGVFKTAFTQPTSESGQDTFARTLAKGVAPFAFKALAGPFKLSNQEAFVAEMVAVTIQTAMDSNPGGTSSVFSELQRTFVEARRRLTVESFHDGDWANASQDEKNEAEDKYNFLFNRTDMSAEGKSQQMAQFAAMGLAHEGISQMLQIRSEKAPSILVDKTFLGALRRTLEKALEWFNGKLTHTYAGQPMDSKLKSLLNQLVEIENKRLATLAGDGRTLLTPLDEGVQKFTDATRKKVAEVAKSDFFKKSKKGVVRGAGAVVALIAEDRMKLLMDGLAKIREKQAEGLLGVAAGSLNYARGPKQLFGVLLQMGKRIEGIRKDLISATSKGVLDSFAEEGKNLTPEANKAITAVLLRTGAHVLLEKYSTQELEQLLTKKQDLVTEITSWEGKLSVFTPELRNEFLDQSKVLAYYLATGNVRGGHMLKNATAIARAYGTQHFGRLNQAQLQEATEIIDSLVSLYAIRYTKATERALVAQVLKDEHARADKGNGVKMALLTHRFMEKDAMERNFGNNPVLMLKGYVPEIYNPHTDIQVVNEEDGAALEDLGYVRGAKVVQDPQDRDQDTKHIYVMRDGGLMPWLTGIMSYTGMRAKGSKHHSNKAKLTQKGLYTAKITEWENRPNAGQYEPALVRENHMAPVLDGSGKAVNYAYLMRNNTKDVLLERDNRLEVVLGSLAGKIYDKQKTTEHNAKAVQALYDEYKETYSESPRAFVTVGPDSTIPELREVYAMLPYETRQEIERVWGQRGMKVRSDMLDIVFGYRKLSVLSAPFEKDKEDRNALEKVMTHFVESALETYGNIMAKQRPQDAQLYKNYGKRGAVFARRFEKVWMALVQETKDTFVVKSGSALIGNFVSNLTLLKLHGVTNSEILKYHQVAYKGAEDYMRDNARLRQLELEVNSKYTLGDFKEIEQEILRLKDALDRNPVAELINKGLMPTIVEDVSTEEDIYSYKAEFARKTEKYTKRLNNKVVAVGRTIYMAHDTQMYKTLSHLTQLSDFVARYTLYQHLISRKENPMTPDQAIQESTDSFVNYDIPMHRKMQYSDDMGFTMFTKYYLSIQRILLQRTRENPGRVMALLLLHNYFDWLPTVLDSSVWAHIGNNPLNMGALKFPTSLDDLATVKAAVSVFK